MRAACLLLGVLTAGGPALAAADRASITLGERNVEEGLRQVGDAPGGDGLSEAAVAAGRACRRNATREAGGRMLYFQVDDAFLAPGNHEVWVRVEYLDAGEDDWYLEYDSNDPNVLKVAGQPGAFKTAGRVLKGDSGRWRYVDFHLPGARFAGRCNGGDFRLNVGDPEEASDCFASITVFRSRPADCQPVEEIRMRPVKAGAGVEVIFGASNFEPGTSREAIAAFFDEARLDWMKALGVTSWESYVRWSALEPEPGKWDFSVYDAEVELLHRAGLRWVPFFIMGPNYATPEWFKQGPQAGPARCLEHGQESAVQSIWNPALPAHVERVMAAFAEHYRGCGMIESVLLGISGDFGEAIYPVSGGGWTGDYHQHGGYWCGDEQARASFARWLEAKYGNAGELNRSWGTDYPSFAAAQYPPVGEHGRPGPALNLRQAAHRRRWLDFIEWYRESMNDWVAFWMAAARKHFPRAEIYLCTGGDGHPTHGSDFTFQCQAAAAVGGGVRITNEGSDYTANLMLTRWVGTAGRHFGGYFTYEPASGVDQYGLAARIYNVAASGARGLFEYSNNVTGSAPRRRHFRANLPLLQRGTPQVDVAFFVPTSYLALHPEEYWSTFFDRPRRFRDYFDYDLVDEGLVRAGALGRYRVLVAVGGNVIPGEVSRAIAAWVRAGGVLVSCGLGRMMTVNGNLVTAWPYRVSGKELQKCARLHGKGALVFFPGSYDDERFASLLCEVVYHGERVAPGVRSAPEVDGIKDGVFTTLRQHDLLFLNSTDQEAVVQPPALPGPVTVPAHGIACVPRPRGL